jgi:upstream activation factor subunit UAF30
MKRKPASRQKGCINLDGTCDTGHGFGLGQPAHAGVVAGGGRPGLMQDAADAHHTAPWRRSMPMKTPEKKTSAGKANGLLKPLQPSQDLAAVIGSDPLPRGKVVSKVWDYIRSHNLQNPENRREILADDKLRKVFGKDKVTMFEMNKHLAQHLK